MKLGIHFLLAIAEKSCIVEKISGGSLVIMIVGSYE